MTPVKTTQAALAPPSSPPGREPREIDLTAPYRREIVAGVLACRMETVIEEMSSQFRSDEVRSPATDYMVIYGFHETIEPFVALFEGVIAEALNAAGLLAKVMDTKNETLLWPLGDEVLLEGAKECMFTVRDSVDQWPFDRLDEFPPLLIASSAFCAELGVEQ